MMGPRRRSGKAECFVENFGSKFLLRIEFRTLCDTLQIIVTVYITMCSVVKCYYFELSYKIIS